MPIIMMSPLKTTFTGTLLIEGIMQSRRIFAAIVAQTTLSKLVIGLTLMNLEMFEPVRHIIKIALVQYSH